MRASKPLGGGYDSATCVPLARDVRSLTARVGTFLAQGFVAKGFVLDHAAIVVW